MTKKLRDINSVFSKIFILPVVFGTFPFHFEYNAFHFNSFLYIYGLCVNIYIGLNTYMQFAEKIPEFTNSQKLVYVAIHWIFPILFFIFNSACLVVISLNKSIYKTLLNVLWKVESDFRMKGLVSRRRICRVSDILMYMAYAMPLLLAPFRPIYLTISIFSCISHISPFICATQMVNSRLFNLKDYLKNARLRVVITRELDVAIRLYYSISSVCCRLNNTFSCQLFCLFSMVFVNSLFAGLVIVSSIKRSCCLTVIEIVTNYLLTYTFLITAIVYECELAAEEVSNGIHRHP